MKGKSTYADPREMEQWSKDDFWDMMLLTLVVPVKYQMETRRDLLTDLEFRLNFACLHLKFFLSDIPCG